MAAALERVAGEGASKLIDWAEDPDITKILATWPARLATPRASRLGLAADGSFDDIVRQYMADNRTPAT